MSVDFGLWIIAAFTVFALLSRQILAWLNVDPEIIRNVALGLLVAFGLIMLSNKLSDKLLGVTQGLANFGHGRRIGSLASRTLRPFLGLL